MLKPKVGDMVRLKLLFVNDVKEYYFLTPHNDYPFHVYNDLIEEIIQSFQPEDRVTGPDGRLGTIVSISDGKVWLRFDSGEDILCRLNEIKHPRRIKC